MKTFCIAVFVCAGAVLAAHGQITSKRTEDYDWKIAQRFDDGRVVIRLSGDDAPMAGVDRTTVLGSALETPPPTFRAKYLDSLVRADADWVRRVTGSRTKAGDRWAIDAGRAGWFETSIDEFVVDSSGCQEPAAVVATVNANRASFGRVKEKYFPARMIGDWTPPPATTRVGPITYEVSDGQRRDIERLLQQAFQRESAKLLAQLGQNRHLPDRQPWQNTYARVTAGAARIRFDVQAFRLTPDALPRLYVRAIWNLDGRTVFTIGAWLRTAPALEIEGVDLHAARFPWTELFERPLEPSINGEVLNVVDIDRDGLAEVLMGYDYYEGFSFELSKYPLGEPSGPQVLAKFGGGC